MTIFSNEIDYSNAAIKDWLDTYDIPATPDTMDNSTMEAYTQDCWDCITEDMKNLQHELNQEFDDRVFILVGNLGRWNGSFKAYKELGSNLNSIFDMFQSKDVDEGTISHDGEDVEFRFSNHDASSYFRYCWVYNDDWDDELKDYITKSKIHNDELHNKIHSTIDLFKEKGFISCHTKG